MGRKLDSTIKPNRIFVNAKFGNFYKFLEEFGNKYKSFSCTIWKLIYTKAMKSEKYETFWSNVSHIISENDMNLKAVSQICRIPYSTVRNQLLRKSPPDLFFVDKFTKYFGVTYEDLLYGEDGIESNVSNAVMRQPDQSDMSEGILYIPVMSQKLSAGKGEDWKSEEDMETKLVKVVSTVARGFETTTLFAAEANGDSMNGIRLYDGDIVVVSKGCVRGDGIYAVSLNNEVMVKRIQFNPLDNKVYVISENPKYETIVVDADNDNFRVLGKVAGWLHGEGL